ncbi:MAG: DUF1810 family protein, partial [Sphingobium sp.]
MGRRGGETHESGYLDHPVLGQILRNCVAALQDLEPTTADALLGPVDAVELRSSLTLFAQLCCNLGRHADTSIAADLGLLDPLMQRLRRTAYLG